MMRGITVGRWLVALLLALTLVPASGVLAEDDEVDEPDSETEQIESSEPIESDDDTVDIDDGAEEPSGDGSLDVSDDDVDDIDNDNDPDDGVDDVDDEDLDDIDDDADDVENDTIDQPIPDQAIVQLRSGVDPYAFAANNNATALRVIPSPNIALLALYDQRSDAEEVADLMDEPEVLWAELNYASRAPEGLPRYFFTSAASEPRLVEAAALPNGLDFDPSHSCVTGTGVVVAVLDTGVDASHPALAGAILPDGVNMVDVTWNVQDVGNGIDDDGDGRIDEMTGHGTHVTGTILQIAPDASILPVKVLDSDGTGDTFTLTAGIFYAIDQGAQVINLSLGSTFDSQAVATAVDTASDRGVVVVAAAGNADRETPPEFPAADPAAISVAATDANGDKARFSNYNALVDISAPGVDVASTYPGGRYSTASGTSMATPLVTGTVALLLDRQPDITPQRALETIQSTSAPLALPDPALEGMLGSGELDIDAAIDCGN